jgi:hypothetical protein
VDCWTGSCEVKVQPLCAAGLLVSLVPLNLLFFYCSMLEYVCVCARAAGRLEAGAGLLFYYCW